jgi:hypothetical protein
MAKIKMVGVWIVRSILLVVFCSLTILTVGPAQAQVPPHQPETICFTPPGPCPMPYFVPSGFRCFCPTPYGLVPGVTG